VPSASARTPLTLPSKISFSPRATKGRFKLRSSNTPLEASPLSPDSLRIATAVPATSTVVPMIVASTRKRQRWTASASAGRKNSQERKGLRWCMPGRIHKPSGARDHGAASEQQTRGTVAGPVWRQLGGGRGEADGTVSPGSVIWLSGAVLARMLDVCSKLCGRAGRARRPRRYGLSRPVMMKLATSQVVRRMRLTSARVGRRGGLPRTRAGVTNRCVWRPCTRSALPSLARCTRGRPRRRLAETSPWRLRCRPTVPRQCYRLATASLGVGAAAARGPLPAAVTPPSAQHAHTAPA
jgi:hypothetical protein